MPIELSSETLISLTEATKHLPRRRGGKKPHVSCLYRWTKSGCKGVILESIQVGGTRCTSREALARFFDALTFGDSHNRPIRSTSQRKRAAEAAERRLAAEGA